MSLVENAETCRDHLEEFVDLENGCGIRCVHESVVRAICTHLEFALTNVRRIDRCH